jgi:hypothetical protein
VSDDEAEVGSVSEEAAKLFAALQEWAKESGGHQARAATEAASGVAAHLSSVNEHIGHGPDCVYCPICQSINFVRETSPEVKAHLASAAGSLFQALAGLMATPPPDGGRRQGVEKIDLTDDAWDED